MRTTLLAAMLAAILPAMALAAPVVQSHGGDQAAISKAIADPIRQADQADDARRKVGDIMQFAQVRPGQKVLELMPGGGYFTRIFSAVVGAHGKVYALWPDEYAKEDSQHLGAMKQWISAPPYTNVSVLEQPSHELSAPAPVDLVFTSQNYHDYPDPFMGSVDLPTFDKQVFAALKPGGLFVIIDHAAPAGTGLQDTNTLHRIDPAIVKQQVEAAGFVFDGESEVLRNPADDHSLKVFDKSIRGHTDQFIYRFRKPAR